METEPHKHSTESLIRDISHYNVRIHTSLDQISLIRGKKAYRNQPFHKTCPILALFERMEVPQL